MTEGPNLQSERFPIISSKQCALLVKLMKKTRRTAATKYKKGLITKDDAKKFFEKCIKNVEEIEKSRIEHMKKLVDNFVNLKNKRILPTDLVINPDRLDKVELISVDEEHLLNKTITEDNIELSESPTECDKTVEASIKQDIADMNVDDEHMDVDMDEISELRNNTTIVECTSELVVCLENMAHLPIEETDEDDNLGDSFEEIPIDMLNEEEQNSAMSKSPSYELRMDIGSAVSSHDEDNIPSAKSTHEIDKTLSSNEAALTLPIESTKLKTKTSSVASSSLSSSTSKYEPRTKHSSSLFKSKYHPLGSAQKTALVKSQVKPTQSYAQNRIATDVKQQRQLPDEKKHQTNKEQQDQLRSQKREQLNKCIKPMVITTVPLVAKVIPGHTMSTAPTRKVTQSSNITTHKTQASILALKTTQAFPLVPKAAQIFPPTYKALPQASKATQIVSSATKTGQNFPSATKASLILPPSSKASLILPPSSKASQALPSASKVSNTIKPPSIIKPILAAVNRPQTIPLVSLDQDKVVFKTPVQIRALPSLSDSCRKIVVDHDSYNLEGLESDNSDDDETEVGQIVPDWAKKNSGTLNRLSQYHTLYTDPARIFARPALDQCVSIPEVFATYNFFVKPRTSSAVWMN